LLETRKQKKEAGRTAAVIFNFDEPPSVIMYILSLSLSAKLQAIGRSNEPSLIKKKAVD